MLGWLREEAGGWPGPQLAPGTRQEIELISEKAASGPRGIIFPWFLPYQDDHTGETPAIRQAYRRMLADENVKASLLGKILAVAALDLKVQPADKKNSRDRYIADFVKWSLTERLKDTMPGLVWSILSGGLIDGYSVSEKVWELEQRGKWAGKVALRELKPKDTGSDVILQTDEYRNIVGIMGLRYNAGVEFHPSLFLTYRHTPLYGTPTGMSDLRSSYRAFWFLDTIWKLRGMGLEKRALPLLVGHWQGSRPDLKKSLENSLQLARSQSWISVPEEARVEAINIAGTADEMFKSAIQDLKHAIFLGISGAMLQSIEGQTTDGRGSSKVHRETADLFVWHLARAIESLLNDRDSGLIRDLVDLNFVVSEYPLATLSAVDVNELKEEMEIDKGLYAMKVPLSREELYERYSRTPPDTPEDTLVGEQGPLGPQGGPGGEGDIPPELGFDEPDSVDGVDQFAEGRWITIGGTRGEDGEHHGGSPVYIKGGLVAKGAPALEGKSLGNMKKLAHGKPATGPKRSLSEPEKQALRDYSGGSAFRVNAALREGVPLTGRLASMDAALQSAFAATTEFARPRTLYRGLSLREGAKQFVSSMKPGKEWHDAGYMSTSRDRADADSSPVSLEIEATHGIDLGELASNQDEGETLLPRGGRFLVVSVKPRAGGYHVRLKQLPAAGERGGKEERLAARRFAEQPYRETATLIAEILYGLYGARALEAFTAQKFAEWNPLHHPRDKKTGRFIPRGSGEAVSAAKAAIGKVLRGGKHSHAPEEIAAHLANLTVAQLKDLHKEHGQKIPGRLRADLVGAVQARLSAQQDVQKPVEKKDRAKPKEKLAKKPPAPAQSVEKPASRDPGTHVLGLYGQVAESDVPDQFRSAFRSGMVPVFLLRQKSDLSEKDFNDTLMQLDREDKLRLVSIGDRSQVTSEQLRDSVQGEGETFFFVEPGPEYQQNPPAQSATAAGKAEKSPGEGRLSVEEDLRNQTRRGYDIQGFLDESPEAAAADRDLQKSNQRYRALLKKLEALPESAVEDANHPVNRELNRMVAEKTVAMGKKVPDAVLEQVEFTGQDAQGREWHKGKLVEQKSQSALAAGKAPEEKPAVEKPATPGQPTGPRHARQYPDPAQQERWQAVHQAAGNPGQHGNADLHQLADIAARSPTHEAALEEAYRAGLLYRPNRAQETRGEHTPGASPGDAYHARVLGAAYSGESTKNQAPVPQEESKIPAEGQEPRSQERNVAATKAPSQGKRQEPKDVAADLQALGDAVGNPEITGEDISRTVRGAFAGLTDEEAAAAVKVFGLAGKIKGRDHAAKLIEDHLTARKGASQRVAASDRASLGGSDFQVSPRVKAALGKAQEIVSRHGANAPPPKAEKPAAENSAARKPAAHSPPPPRQPRTRLADTVDKKSPAYAHGKHLKEQLDSFVGEVQRGKSTADVTSRAEQVLEQALSKAKTKEEVDALAAGFGLEATGSTVKQTVDFIRRHVNQRIGYVSRTRLVDRPDQK